MNGAASYYASYGDQQSAAGSSYAYGSWMLVRMATTNLDMVISTNGIMVAGVTATVVSTNTTDTFKVGANLVVQSGSMKWNVARIQLIRWDGVLQKDLIATANGTFTNVADGAVVNFGVSGTGGTSADSINVQGQNFPPPTMMNWK